ncbi:DUF917 domain-containing protein [Bifidobacterium sp. ESL0690]|uniref:DUF917 domain-containing protein n=1 Tax=Bifidobacterium sp. ESL0690 TaxID=2983214 RepID=UPI0023F7DE4A|nr:DUF917 domain-containing protein [Bifidobacterium sp. ESL0690]WEV45910.1 DUF917 domain-containing protein [Bifidobacterium sp. ESL0690]
MQKLVSSDIPDIALGSSLLGAGGGGDPYGGSLIARQALEKVGSIDLYDAEEVPDDWIVATIGGVGAPSVMAEKGINGCEFPNLLKAMKEQTGHSLNAFVLSEIGGMNSVIPVAASAVAGIPLVNVDGMGRAFPGLQQDSYNIAGVHTWPMAFADEKGNVAMLTTIDNDWMENLGRAAVDAMGGQGIALGQLMSGKTMKRAAVRDSLTKARFIGRTIRTIKEIADEEGVTPREAFLKKMKAKGIIEAKIADVTRETKGGFNYGLAKLEGIRSSRGHQAAVEFQNENLIAYLDGKAVATVPDLICMVDADTFTPVTTENLKYGKRVLLLVLEADKVWHTQAGIDLAGPRWFGYDLDYIPFDSIQSEL